MTVVDSEALYLHRCLERDLAGTPRVMSPGEIAAAVMPFVRRYIDDRDQLTDGNQRDYSASLKQWADWKSELMEIAGLRYGGDDEPTMETVLGELWKLRQGGPSVNEPFLGPAEVGHIVARDAHLYGAGFTYRGQPLDPADVVVYMPSRAVLVPPSTPQYVVDRIEDMLMPYREASDHG